LQGEGAYQRKYWLKSKAPARIRPFSQAKRPFPFATDIYFLGKGPLTTIAPFLSVIPSVRWAFGPPKEMKNAASFGNCPFFTTTLSFLSFRAQRGICGAPLGCLKFRGIQAHFPLSSRLPRRAVEESAVHEPFLEMFLRAPLFRRRLHSESLLMNAGLNLGNRAIVNRDF
jgi:hypothetical protein